MNASDLTAVQIRSEDLARVKDIRAVRYRAGEYDELPPLWKVLGELIDQALAAGEDPA